MNLNEIINGIDNGDFESVKKLFSIFYEGKNTIVRCAFDKNTNTPLYEYVLKNLNELRVDLYSPEQVAPTKIEREQLEFENGKCEVDFTKIALKKARCSGISFCEPGITKNYHKFDIFEVESIDIQSLITRINETKDTEEKVRFLISCHNDCTECRIGFESRHISVYFDERRIEWVKSDMADFAYNYRRNYIFAKQTGNQIIPKKADFIKYTDYLDRTFYGRVIGIEGENVVIEEWNGECFLPAEERTSDLFDLDFYYNSNKTYIPIDSCSIVDKIL